MAPLLPSHIPFALLLLLLLVAAKVFGELCERFKLPAMIGEVLAGIILGPSVFAIIQPSHELKVLADLGILLLIIRAGMEVDVEEIRRSVRGRHGWIAIMTFCIPFLSGLATGYFFGFDYTFTIFLGLCIAITALPVSIRILIDLGQLKSEIGQRIISAAVFSDVVALLILGIILDFKKNTATISDFVFSSVTTLAQVVIFLAVLFLGYRLFLYTKSQVGSIGPKMDRFLRYLRGRESLFALMIIFILSFASLSELMGLHFVVGAFFGTILIPRSIFNAKEFANVRRTTASITMGFLAPIFFAFIGISFQISWITDVWLLIVILGIAFVSKFAGGFLGGKLAGLSGKKSITLGVGLNARGIMELVIANIALQRGFINLSVFSILVLMALLTTLLTPFLLQLSFKNLLKT
jgi:Kef-type K+ transport system membrane component KefB